MAARYADDARDHVAMLRAHDQRDFAAVSLIARGRGCPFVGQFGGVVSGLDVTRSSTAEILKDVGRVRPGFYLASNVARDDVPENVRADPCVREPNWKASGGARRGQLNSFDGYETKYMEATYKLDGTRYAMKCKATRAEHDTGEVHGPVVIQVYVCDPTGNPNKKRRTLGEADAGAASEDTDAAEGQSEAAAAFEASHPICPPLQPISEDGPLAEQPEVVRGATVADAADAASVTDSVTSDVSTAPSSITATTASTTSVPRVDPSAATAAIGQAATEGQNARQQLKELCEKFSADLSIAEVTDVLVPKGSFSFEFAVDGLRCGVGSARSKKEAKEQAAALALRALAREPPRDL
jgi:hypothetical protein